MNAKLDFRNVFSTGWKIFSKNWMILIGLLLAYMIIQSLFSFFFFPNFNFSADANNPELFLVESISFFSSPYFIFISLLSFLFSSVFYLLFEKILLDLHKGKEPYLYFNLKKFLNLVVANILVNIFIMIGCFLFIIPGIYLALRLQFFSLLIIEKDAGILDSLTKSWQMTQGNVGNLFVLSLSFGGIFLVGLILLFVGMFPAAVLVYTLRVSSYKALSPDNEELKEEENMPLSE